MLPIPPILREPPRVVEPDGVTLLRRLGGKLQHADLAEIARCNHGIDVGQHLDGLSRILAGDTSRPLEWHPGEVLELTRWGRTGCRRARGLCLRGRARAPRVR